MSGVVWEDKSASGKWFKNLTSKKSFKNLRSESKTNTDSIVCTIDRAKIQRASTAVITLTSKGSEESLESEKLASNEHTLSTRLVDPIVYAEQEKIKALAPILRAQSMPLPASLIAFSGKEVKPGYTALFTRESFRKVLDDPVGVHKFGRFLAEELAAEQLCFWLNAEQHAADFSRLQSLSKRIHDLHVPSNATLALNLSSIERQNLAHQYQMFMQSEDPFATARIGAFEAMYTDSWPRFVKHRLNLASNLALRADRQHIYMSFCLVNASLGQEILMASHGFVQLTGQHLSSIVGHNCRFLQGPGTSKKATRRIRDACAKGISCQELLLNYKRHETEMVPVWILLRVEPLRDATGTLRFFLGHQIALSPNSADVAFLLSDDLDEDTCISAESSLVQQQHAKTKEAAASVISSRQDPATITPLSMAKVVTDRDQRLKDASALAFDATAARPMSSAGRSFGNSQGSPTNLTPTVRQKSPIGLRPTSAGGRTSTPARSADKKHLSAFDGIEEEADLQTKALNKFLIIEAESSKILFSSPSLPADFAQGRNFFDLVTKQNSTAALARIAKCFKQQEPSEVEINLSIDGGKSRSVVLHIASLLKAAGEIAAIVVLFSNV